MHTHSIQLTHTRIALQDGMYRTNSSDDEEMPEMISDNASSSSESHAESATESAYDLSRSLLNPTPRPSDPLSEAALLSSLQQLFAHPGRDTFLLQLSIDDFLFILLLWSNRTPQGTILRENVSCLEVSYDFHHDGEFVFPNNSNVLLHPDDILEMLTRYENMHPKSMTYRTSKWQNVSAQLYSGVSDTLQTNMFTAAETITSFLECCDSCTDPSPESVTSDLSLPLHPRLSTFIFFYQGEFESEHWNIFTEIYRHSPCSEKLQNILVRAVVMTQTRWGWFSHAEETYVQQPQPSSSQYFLEFQNLFQVAEARSQGILEWLFLHDLVWSLSQEKRDHWLQALSVKSTPSCFAPTPETACRMLQEWSDAVDPSKAPSQMCGYTFSAGDIVWTCRQCQKDDTCVMCNACFQNSHTKLNAEGQRVPLDGHDVYFNLIPRDLPPGQGGCCDCGDEEALNSQHFCPRHRIDHPTTTTTTTTTTTAPEQETTKGNSMDCETKKEDEMMDVEEMAILPPQVAKGGNKIMTLIVRCFVEMDTYERLRRETHGIQEFQLNTNKTRRIPVVPWKRSTQQTIHTRADAAGDADGSTTFCPSDKLPLGVKGWGWRRLISFLDYIGGAYPSTRLLLARTMGESVHPLRYPRYSSRAASDLGYFPVPYKTVNPDFTTNNYNFSNNTSNTSIADHKVSLLRLLLHNTTTSQKELWNTNAVTKQQHALLMKVLALFEFKDTFSIEYIRSYSTIYRRLLNNETQDNTAIFVFSVQFMNRKTHVEHLVVQRFYYEIMLTSLLKCLIEATPDLTLCGDQSLDGRRWSLKSIVMNGDKNRSTMASKKYRLPLTDLRYALNNEGMMRAFVESLRDWKVDIDWLDSSEPSEPIEPSEPSEPSASSASARRHNGFDPELRQEEIDDTRIEQQMQNPTFNKARLLVYSKLNQMSAFQLWIEILLRSNGLHPQRRKRGDAVALQDDAW